MQQRTGLSTKDLALRRESECNRRRFLQPGAHPSLLLVGLMPGRMTPSAVWMTLALASAPGCHSLKPLLTTLGSAGQHYAALSTAHPMATAAVTAGSILCAADMTCQMMLENQTAVDMRRTAALTLFGTWHYGVPAKTLYMLYDHFLGTAPTLMNSIYKMLIDVYLHGPLLVIPSFYPITFAMRGQPLRSTMTQLKKEWWRPRSVACSSDAHPALHVPLHTAALQGGVRGGFLVYPQDVAVLAEQPRGGARLKASNNGARARTRACRRAACTATPAGASARTLAADRRVAV